MSDFQIENPSHRIAKGVMESNLELVRSGFQEDPSLAHESHMFANAVNRGNASIVEAMLDFGCDVNASTSQLSSLSAAIGRNFDDIVELLLSRGVDTSVGRPLISALGSERGRERSRKYVKLLVEHGVDVNKIFDLHGDSTNQFTALNWTKDPEIIAYLRKHGAKTVAELKGKDPRPDEPLAGAESPESSADAVRRYFSDNVGPVDPKPLNQVIPLGHPISVHAIKPSGNRKHLTLFTTGVSAKAMKVPNGQDEYAYAELFIELPADWPFENATAKIDSWPMDWLHDIGQYPHDNDTWLGGPLTIIAMEEPPKPLAPGLAFTSMMLLAEKSFKRGDGKEVALYRLVPLHTDERELEIRQGAPALMRAFDRNSVPFVVDINRPSVAP